MSFDVEIPLRRLFELRTIAALASEIAAGTPGALPRLAPRTQAGDPPLSFAQLRLWFLARLEPDSAAYNMPSFFVLRGPLDRPRLDAALGEVVRRHEILRTSFIERDGVPVQRIAPPSPWPQSGRIPIIDLARLPEARREAEARRLAHQEAWRPFDLSRLPLLRTLLLRLDEEEHAFLLATHHIVSDGWSLGVLMREVASVLAAAPLPPLPVQYADYALWQQSWLQGEPLEQQLAFWRRQLQGAPPVLDLPTDRPRPALQSFRGIRVPFVLSAGLLERLRGLAQRESTTLFMVLLAGLEALLFRLTGQEDFCVGAPVAGRTRLETEPLIGLFVNTLAHRADLSGEPLLDTLLARVRETALAAQAHQEVPFEKLVEALQPERNLSHSPLFQVMLAFQNASWQTGELPGLSLRPLELDSPTAKLDLNLILDEIGDGVWGGLEVDTALFDRTTALRLLAQLRTLLDRIAADPRCPVGELPLLPAAERHQVLVEWNDTAVDRCETTLIHELFEAWAERAPGAVAAVCGGESVTYAELAERANLLANHLASLGIGPGSLVGIHLRRGLRMIQALLAVLKAGAAYVPLEVGHPPARLRRVFDSLEISCLLTETAQLGSLPAVSTVICLDRDVIRPIRPIGPIRPISTPDDLAYVIFTSGSTGTPKGVMVRHRPVVNLIRWAHRAFAFSPTDRVLFVTSLSFDLSVFDVFGLLGAGGSIRIATEEEVRDPERLLRALVEEPITFWDSAPAALEQTVPFLDRLDPRVHPALRLVFLSGDWIPVTLPGRIRERFPGARVVSLGGATEATVWSNVFPVDAVDPLWTSIPYGRPIDNARYHVLDPWLAPCPVGVPGDLFIGGSCLADGYAREPELTADRFIPDPWGVTPGSRLYRTGDRARYRPDGNLEFLGRRDTQVKIRGFRIELGEIEAALATLPGVRDAVVVAGDRRLVAYVVGDVPADELRRSLRERLPDYMVPASFVALAALPLTPNGKVDRKALPVLEQQRPEAHYLPPRTPVEEILAGIWSELLGLERIGAADDFFALGGHSLLATQVISRLRDAFGVELPLRDLFEAPSPAELAVRIEAAQRAGPDRIAPPLVKVRRVGDPPLSFAQERLWFLDQLEPGAPTWNIPGTIELAGRLDVTAFAAALAGVVGRHEVLRTVFRLVDGEPRQHILPALASALPVLDLAALPPALRQAEAERLAAEQALHRFDLARGPLLRAALLRLEREDRHRLLVVLHHAICDGWSLPLLVREAGTLYAAFTAGRPSPLAELPIQYADFAVWQREVVAASRQTELTWWLERLSGEIAPLELPTDRPRPVVQTFRGRHSARLLPPGLATRLNAFGRAHGATLFMTLLAAIQALLHRHSGQDDVLVGAPVAGRRAVATENLVGCFLNTLVLRTGLDGDPGFRDLVARVREVTLGAYSHQDVPFEAILAALPQQRDLSRTPLFQVMVNLLNLPSAAMRLPELTLESSTTATPLSKLDMTFYVSEEAGGVRIELVYNADLFDAARMEDILAQLEALLDQALERPEAPIGALSLVTAAARAVLPDPAAELSAAWEGAVHEIFARHAGRAPDALAAVDSAESWSYGELAGRAGRLAAFLRAHGVGPGDIVALWAHRSAPLVWGVLGVLQAGAAFLMLDPRQPAPCQARMLGVARPAAWLQVAAAGPVPAEIERALDTTDCACRLTLPTRAGDSGFLADFPAGAPFPMEERPVGPDDLAYVAFTSGSTGVPKGVLGRHGSLSHFIPWLSGRFGLSAADRFSMLSGLAHDPLHRDLFTPLQLGAAVVIPDPETMEEPGRLAAWMRREGVTVAHLTPALGQLLTTEAADGPRVEIPSLRWAFLVGDVLTRRDVARLRGLAPGITCVNYYGSTETQRAVGHHVAEDDGARVKEVLPLGRGIPDVQLLVLNPVGALAGIGELGEISVRSPHIALGYLGDPRLTAERFMADLYRTGDLGRYRPNGEAVFAGRADTQVKIRGFRIELGEIESVLGGCPGVREAVVVARQDGGEERYLAAYVVPAAGATLAERELRVFLRRRLPDSMVPAAFVLLDRMPLTPNRKVDRKALPAPERQRPKEGSPAPRTPVEEVLAGIWAEVLGIERIGAADDFFALGGHSLLATRVVSRLRSAFGVEIPLRALFEAPTLADLASRVEAALRDGAGRWAPPLVPVPREGPLPLSFAQQRLWFIDQLEPGSPLYNIPVALRVEGPLDAAVLARCLAEIVRRHEALRTVFAEQDGAPVQVIRPAAPFALAVVDLSGLPEGAREAAALYAAFAEGRPSPLPELPVQYADFAAWQLSWLYGEVLESEISFWRRQLAGLPPLLELPTDRPRPAVQSFRGASRPVRLPSDLTRQMQALSRREGATLFMVLLAGYQALLARSSGQEDLAVGTPVAGRNREETEGLIGFFVNTLVLRGDLSSQPTFRELLGRVRETALAAHTHQDVPFERLVQELTPERSLAHTPLFQVVLALQNVPTESLEVRSLRLRPVNGGGTTAKFDLTLSLVEHGGAISGTVEHATDLFDGTTVDRLILQYERLLAAAVAAPEIRISELPLLSPAERHQVLVEWNDTEAARGEETLIHELFEAWAARTPGAIAAVCGGETMTYGEVEDRANRLAHHLASLGIGPGSLVGIHLRRGLRMIPALLAVLKAGAAYVPLEVGHPPARLRQVLETLEISCVLTETAQLGSLPAVSTVICLDAIRPIRPIGPIRPIRPISPDDLTYVIFTSGSTGTPKGVMVRHRPVINLIRWAHRTFAFSPADRVLCVASLSFDLSVFDVFGLLGAGGSVRIATEEEVRDPERLLRALAEEPITFWDSAPAALEQTVPFLDRLDPQVRPALRLVFLSGDWIPVALPDRIHERFPGVQVIALGGATEATVWSNVFPVGVMDPAWASIPYGRPIENARYHVLDPQLAACPVGVPGDLYIGGECLADGYAREPELTAHKLLPDPWGITPGARLYRTGDRARYREDGNLEFLGRRDHQVKIRGFRIELGEIEAALSALPGVREAVVVVREDPRRLVAYMVGEADMDALRRSLRERLPDYMVPADFVTLVTLPLTPNGKVDRKALPAPERQVAEESALAPRTPVEEILAGIWAELLGRERVGATDHFFDLGGHSLLATQVMSRLRSAFDVDMPLRDLFEAPTLADLAARVEAARLKVDRPAGADRLAPPLVPVPRQGALPLSFAQQRLWFIAQLEPGSPLYNLPVALRVEGALDVAVLACCLTEIVRRHEVLRTVFPATEGAPVQVIQPAAPFVLPVVDLSGLPESRREALAHTLAGEEAGRPFDLAHGPLLRGMLLRLAEEDHVAALTLHHIASDGWSMDLLVREAGTLYAAFAAGRPSPLPELPVQYADFAAWQHSWLHGEVLENEISFWRWQLADLPPLLEIPTDHPRPAVQSFRGASRPVRLPVELTQQVRDLSRREGATLFMVLLAGFQAVLARASGQEDLAVGTPVAGRNRVEIEGLIGFFVNTLVLRGSLTGEPSFRELLGRVRETSLAAHAHQDVPFERLVQELAPERSLAHAPLFQAMLALQNAPVGNAEIEGLHLKPVGGAGTTAKFDLTLSLTEHDGELAGTVEYATDLFDGTTIDRLVIRLERLLAAVVAAPDRNVWELPLLGEAEVQQTGLEWNDTSVEWSVPPLLHTLVAAQAARAPERIAVEQGDRALTAGELEAQANRLARLLLRRGVQPEDRVAICCDRSPEMVVSLLAVWKVGAAWVPLEPTYPTARRAVVLEDARPVVLIAGPGAPVDLLQETGVLDLAVVEAEPAGSIRQDPPRFAISPDNLAYAIYTSGSTGRPKGVLVSHGAIANRLLWMQRAFPLGETDAVLQKTPFVFDAAIWEIFLPLCTGARLVLAPPDAHGDPAAMALEARERSVTVLQLVPSVLGPFLDEDLRGVPLRRLFCGGEALPAPLCERAFELLPGIELHNLYGPTECAIDVTSHPCEPGLVGAIAPLGRPLDNLQVRIMDRRQQPMPPGQPGELCAGGAGLARGYLGRSDLTAERFVPDPCATAPGSRLYRTGDLVRQRPDGTLHYLGRIDHQVKIRGVRIELGEVESALSALAGVRQAAVVVRDGSLIAYVVGDVMADALRQELRERLPDTMMPSAFVLLAALPLTPTGKVDRKALPAPERQPSEERFQAPRTPVEQALAGIWAELLGLPGVSAVGIQDDFFALGGHSLLAAQAVSRIRRSLGTEVPLRRLFELRTIAALAPEVAFGLLDTAGSLPPLIPRTTAGDPPLSFAQLRLWFLARLEPDSAAYNMPVFFSLRGPLDRARLDAALTEVVRRHEILRTSFAERDGAPVQRIAPPEPVRVPLVDLTALPAERREAEARLPAHQEAWRPFDLSRRPLLRALLLRLDAEEHAFLLAAHHIVSDGWSLGVLMREVAALLGGVPLPELPVQYADYALWQQSWLHGEPLERQLAFWRRQLQGAPPVLDLPTDHPRPALQAFRGARVPFALPAGLLERLRGVARQEGATLFMVLLAGLEALLFRITGEEDFCVGAPVAGRVHLETEPLIGLFVNTLVHRADLSGAPRFDALLARVRETALAAQSHQEIPFEKLVEALQPERNLSHSPLFQVMLAFQNAAAPAAELPGLSLSPLEIDSVTTKFDLNLMLVETGAGVAGGLEFDTGIFDRTTALRLLEQLRTLLDGIAADPLCPVADLPLLLAAERHQVLVEWNDTAVDRGEPTRIHELFEAWAARTPQATAAVWRGEAITYGAVEEQANRLAHHLARLGFGPGSLVGVHLRRGPDMIVAPLAVLKAGAAYVPLEVGHPPARLRWILEALEISCVLTETTQLGGLPALDHVICLDQPEAIRPIGPIRPISSPDDLAYVIFTSGSTGTPKGVMVRHRPVVNLLRWAYRTFAFSPADRVLFVTSLSFDLSVFDVFGLLGAGGSIRIATEEEIRDPERLLRALAEEPITFRDSAPAALEQTVPFLAAMDQRRPDLRLVFLSGDWIPVTLPDRIRTRFPGARVVALGGATEATVWSNVFPVEEVDPDWTSIPYGRPIDNGRYHVLDPRLAPCPMGVPGDLYIGGDCLADGYAREPELTAEKFLPDPWSTAPGDRLYRTGDRARHRPDGNLEFLGRRDHQVKIRGFRIELGEIEAALSLSGVREAVVVVREGRLVAYVTGDAPVDAMRQSLRERLPDYMVPAAFVALAALPLTPNGKVDRKALPAPEQQGAEGSGREPRTPVEEILAGLWAEVLGLERVGPADHFFDLGGHSLLATQVLSRLRDAFGVELPLRDLFEAPVLADLAARVEAARRAGAEPLPPPPVPVSRDGDLPLSFAQQRLWFIDQLALGSPLYNIPLALRVEGPLHSAVLALCLSEIVRRHEALRTVFAAPEGSPVQVIQPAVPFELPVVDLSGIPRADCEAILLAGAEAVRPFELARGPLLRGVLLRLSEGDHVVALTLHHIVGDGWSMGLLVHEVTALYAAFAERRPSPLPELPLQYADFSAWQRSWLQGVVLDREIAYWRRQLSGLPPLLELPTDRPRPAVQSLRGAARPVRLPAGLTRQIAALSRREGATLFMMLLAGFQALLARFSGQQDLAVGSPVAGRNRVEIEGLIGFFVNTLVLRARLTGNLPGDRAYTVSFRELLGRTRETALAAHAHQDLPFEKLVQELTPERSLSHTPLFQVMLVLQNTPLELLEIPSLRLRPAGVAATTAKFDLTLTLAEHGGGLAGTVEYATDLFDGTTIDRLIGHFERLLAAAVAAPELPVAELSLLAEAERHQLCLDWNDTGRSGFSGCVHELFERQARRASDAVAVVFGGEALTYAGLAARAGRLAGRLRRLGVGPDVLVGLLVERSLDMIVGVLGILQAGGAYVPLDPRYPEKRLAFMLEDTSSPVLLTQEHLLGSVPAGNTRVVCLDAKDGAFESLTSLGSLTSFSPDSLAYVIYTSGSTGKPKGVALSHGALRNLIDWHLATLLGGVPTLQFASLSFDASFHEMFACWGSGGTLVVVPEELRRDLPALAGLLVERQIEKAILPVVVLTQLADLYAAGADLPPLREVTTTGERLQTNRAMAALLRRLPGCAFHNHYGPSETHVATASTLQPDPDDWAVEPPIGRPIRSSSAHVLEPGLVPAPLGVPGDLHLGGACVARGYLGRSDLTAERFVPDPFAGEPGARLYRTGDKVRRAANGDLEYLGRFDDQVKIRGFRIEPGEIEEALLALDGVHEAVVLAREEGDRRLVAYVAGDAIVEDLRRSLRERLPDYMVPAAFVILPAFPLTPNGKVDRRALPAPERESAAAGGRALRTPVEEVLAGIWAELLGVERVGAADHFFDLGGHSLLATRVMARLRSAFGGEMPLRDLFEAPVLADLAARVEAARHGGALSAAPPLVPMPREGPLPLSFAQQRLWFIDQLEPGSPLYNIPVALRVAGPLDPRVLALALGEIVRRHEVLRTVFAAPEGVPVQVIQPAEPFELPVVDLSELPSLSDRSDLEARHVRALIQEEAARPFDLARGPLLRGLLLRLAPEDHVVALAMHHIVSDGWSLGILVREVGTLHAAFAAGRPSPLPELPVQYADFAAWQIAWLAGEVLEGEIAYWRRQLAGLPPLLELPTDRPRPAVQSFRGATRPVRLPAALTRQVRDLSRREGGTPFMVLLAGFQALLARWSGQDDLAVGTPVAGRNRVEIEGSIGFFINTLVLRGGSAGKPFRELLGRTRETALAAHAHQDVPFEKLVQELAPERSLAHAPLFQVMLALQNAPVEDLDLPGLRLRPVSGAWTTSKFDLTLSLAEEAGGLAGAVEHATALFDAVTIDRLILCFERLLAAAVAAPELPAAELPLLSAAERHQTLAEWNDMGTEGGWEGSVTLLVERRSRERPEDPAVVDAAGRVLTYGELDERAGRLAGYLRALGAGPETVVGVLVERSLELVAGLLGVLKAGAAYLPLDPTHPAERLALMLDETAAPVVLTQEALLGRLPATRARIVCLDRDRGEIERHPAVPAVAVEPDHLAYVLYTSGSTGRPKGAQIPHRGLMSLVRWDLRAHGTGPGDRRTQVASLGFDASVWEIWSCLASGAALHLPEEEARIDPQRLCAWMAARGITVSFLPTPLAEALLTLRPEGPEIPTLRRLLTGGDRLRLHPDPSCGFALVNNYGPTEASVVTTSGLVPPRHRGETGSIPSLGRPIDGLRVCLLDRSLLPVPPGMPGELWVGGPSLARGYLGDPGRTAERFAPDPFPQIPGERLYRTGDLCRHRHDGSLEFLGRADHQVKVRGFRIELGEIEAALSALDGVREAVVVMREERLVAYVVSDAAADALRRSLGERLRERLPDYMVPAAFVTLAALPLTPNGKVDRQALPAPELQSPEGSFLAPRTPVEEVLAGIWAELLGVERVGADAHFFELGGHSLLATRVMSRLRSALDVEMPLRDLFEAPRLADLAARVEAALQTGAGRPAPPLVPLVPEERKEPLPLSFAQQRLWLLDQLEPGSPLYNIAVALRIDGPLQAGALALSLGEVVRRHEVLRTVFAARRGSPVQVIVPAAPFELPVVDLSALPERAREAAALALAGEEAGRPFDLSREPLLRGVLLRLEEQDHVVALTVHHIASDGWSMGILVREVTALYATFAEGRSSPLPELPVQYADFAVWQRGWLEGEALERQLDYWRERLAGLAAAELPADRSRPPVRSGRGAAVPVSVPGALAEALRDLGRQEDATLFMALLAAFSVVVHRYSGRDRVILGTDIANRRHAELEGLIGLFVNQLVLRVDLAGDPTFREVLRQVRRDTLEAYMHQDAPFDRLVEMLRPERDLSRTPLFQLKLMLQNATFGRVEMQSLRDLSVSGLHVPQQTAKFDLLLNLIEIGDGIGGQAEYSTDLFEAATIARLLDRFALVLRCVAEHPDARLHEIDAELARQEAQEEEQREQERRSLALSRARRRVLVDQTVS